MVMSIPTAEFINEIIFPFDSRVRLLLFFDAENGLNAVQAIPFNSPVDGINQFFFATTRAVTGQRIVESLNATVPVFESVLAYRSESGRWPIGAGSDISAAFFANLPD